MNNFKVLISGFDFFWTNLSSLRKEEDKKLMGRKICTETLPLLALHFVIDLFVDLAIQAYRSSIRGGYIGEMKLGIKRLLRPSALINRFFAEGAEFNLHVLVADQ